MAPTAQSPAKLYEHTKAKVRHAAAVQGVSQVEFLEKAVDEYVANHIEDFAKMLREANAVLLGDNLTAAVAYALDLSDDDMSAIAGPSTADGAHRRA